MSFALISPIEPREGGYRVAEVAAQSFEVAPPFFWVECPDYVVADEYWYNPENGEFVPVPVPEPIVTNGQQPITTGTQTL